MRRPLCIELFCGTFGWSAGWHEMGGRAVGYDIEHLPHHGPVRPGDDLILQDVRTIDGRRFKEASLILCSPPCQEFSYMAMPWTRAKQIAAALRGRGEFPAGYTGSRTVAELTALFDACFRIQREASDAAGRYIPMVVENVRGAQPWVGRARWSYGSYALWGDVPALMPIVTRKGAMKVGDVGWRRDNDIHPVGFNVMAARQLKAGDEEPKYILDDIRAGKRRVAGGVYDGETGRTTKNDGGSWFNVAHNTTSGKGRNPDGRDVKVPGLNHGHFPPGGLAQGHIDGVKQSGISGERDNGKGDRWFQDGAEQHGSKSSARKAASARIAKIPLALASHIAKCYYPVNGDRHD